MVNRREFLRNGAFTAAALAAAGRAGALVAEPVSTPIGLELYTVRNQLAKDFDGTLKQVAGIGYKLVEMFSLGKRTPAQVRQSLAAAGLTAPSGHTNAEELKRTNVDEMIDKFHATGFEYMVCSFPAFRPGGEGKAKTPRELEAAIAHDGLGADDYKWMADLFNHTAEKCQKAGLQFAYHAHNVDLKPMGDSTAVDQLLAWTDAKLVGLELDCYWFERAGKNPVDYFKRYAGRVPLIHLKDMTDHPAPTTDLAKGADAFTEVGRGSIDWKSILRAAPAAGVKYGFVEQDKCAGPPIESAKISFDYLKNLQV
jgi:sugar phosphate isomerase/epimerase